MEIREWQDKKTWNQFVISQKRAQFCQSFEWGEFQKSLGRKIYRLAVIEDDKILAICLLIKMKLPLGKGYFYSPRGPIIAERIQQQKSEIINSKFKIIIKCLTEKIKELANQEGIIFWRFEPTSKLQVANCKLQVTSPVQPSKTLILNLDKSPEQLLSTLHPKTRYNIKLAEKRGIKISYSYRPEDEKAFLSLIHETALRDNFKPHPDFYYQKMIEILGRQENGNELMGVYYLRNEMYERCFLKLIQAQLGDKILVSNILVYFGDTVTYLHGASLSEKRNLMAPFLCQWQAILDAQELGYQFYDFWGINEKKWPGVTRFKLGFNGQIIEYPGTFDVILDKFWYKIYYLGKRFL